MAGSNTMQQFAGQVIQSFNPDATKASLETLTATVEKTITLGAGLNIFIQPLTDTEFLSFLTERDTARARVIKG